jgi:hypothetical protein
MYRATLHAAGITDPNTGAPMDADFTFDFFMLNGDANHDGIVNITDLMALATNYNGVGKTFAQGDFNFDGNVDAADLAILAGNWQKKSDGTFATGSAMPANLIPPPPIPTAPARRTAVRVVQLLA